MVTKPDFQGFDQGIPVSKEQAQVMASNGMKFVGRYINGTWKKMQLAESQMLSAMGFKIFSIYQTTATMALGSGLSHGIAARELAESLKQPTGTAIYFAVDFDVTKESQYAAIREFFIGVKKGLGAAYKVGIYGEYELMVWAAENNGIAERFFQTYAWSGGKCFSGNHVFQYQNGFNLKGYEIDLCKTNNLDEMWSYHVKEVNPVETDYNARITELEKIVKNIVISLTKITDDLMAVKAAPDWFVNEFPDALDLLSDKTGTDDFWRAFAVCLRVMEKHK